MNINYFINNWKNIKEEDISFTKDEWKEISCYKYLAEEFIEKYQDKVYWYWISIHQSLSEEFIEKYQNKVDWGYISQYQSLSEEFIEKYENKVDWYLISKYQKLSEAFIEKHEDKLDWYWIPRSQNLSIQFIFKYQDKINFSDYLKCLSRCFRLRCVKYIGRYRVSFSIHSNNNYAVIIDSSKGPIILQNIPANIIFCHTL